MGGGWLSERALHRERKYGVRHSRELTFQTSQVGECASSQRRGACGRGGAPLAAPLRSRPHHLASAHAASMASQLALLGQGGAGREQTRPSWGATAAAASSSSCSSLLLRVQGVESLLLPLLRRQQRLQHRLRRRMPPLHAAMRALSRQPPPLARRRDASPRPCEILEVERVAHFPLDRHRSHRRAAPAQSTRRGQVCAQQRDRSVRCLLLPAQ